MKATIGCIVLAMVLAAAPGAAQDGRDATLRVSAFGGVSLRQGPTSFGFARDVRNAALRATLPALPFQPWVQGTRFVRPNLECLPAAPCNADGWTALGGMTVPLSADDTETGIHAYLLVGVGAAFSERNRFAYLFGFGAALAVTRRIAPAVELRWEDLPGIRNVMILSLGLRLDLF